MRSDYGGHFTHQRLLSLRDKICRVDFQFFDLFRGVRMHECQLFELPFFLHELQQAVLRPGDGG